MGALSSRSSVMFESNPIGKGKPIPGLTNTSSRPSAFTSPTLTPQAQYVSSRIGATVRAKAGNRTFMKYNDGKSGYLAQSVLPLYFGLGEATKIDRIEIDWPSGVNRS